MRRSRIAIGPGPFGPETPEESGKSTPGQGPKSAQRVRPGVSKEPRGTHSGLFSDSSGVPGPKGPGDPVWGGADRKLRTPACVGGPSTRTPHRREGPIAVGAEAEIV